MSLMFRVSYIYLICMQAEHFVKEAGKEQPGIILFVMHENSESICMAHEEYKEWMADNSRFVLQYITL